MPDYKVNRAGALRYLGYAGQALDAEMEARIDENIAACEREARLGLCFARFPLRRASEACGLRAARLCLGAPISRAI